jgi:hypothetical protein
METPVLHRSLFFYLTAEHRRKYSYVSLPRSSAYSAVIKFVPNGAEVPNEIRG